MKTWIGIGLLALRASWKWLLALFVVVVLVAAGFIVRGILLEDSEAEAAINVETSEPTKAPAATYMPKAIPTQVPKATAVSPSREDVGVGPTPVVAPTRPAATPTIAPPPPTPAAPTAVDVPINLTGASNVGSLEFVLSYDPEVLQLTNVAPGALANAAVIASNTLDAGRVWIGIADAKGMDGAGDVAIVTFEIVGQQQGSTALTLEQVTAYDATTLVDILSDATAGAYTIEGQNVTGPTLAFTR